MRVNLFPVLSILCLSRQIKAIFVDDAGVVDWHHALVGRPGEDSTVFHQPHHGSQASLIYTLSENNVVAAINPRDSAIIWRHQLTFDKNITGHLRVNRDSDTIKTAIGSRISAWSSADGRLEWDFALASGVIKDIQLLKQDVVVLLEDSTNKITYVHGQDGVAGWSYTEREHAIPVGLSIPEKQIRYISIQSGGKIKITNLDVETGKVVDHYVLHTERDIAHSKDIVFLGSKSNLPILAWLDKSNAVLKTNVLGSKTISSFNLALKNGERIKNVHVHAPEESTSKSHFLLSIQTSTHSWAQIFHVNLKKSTITKAYDLAKIASESAFSTTVKGTDIYFTRITAQEMIVVSSESQEILNKWNVNGLEDQIPLRAITELSIKGETISAARSAILYDSGDWILIRDGQIEWKRHEELAHTITTTWAYPIIQSAKTAEIKKEIQSNLVSAYIHRLTRHIYELTVLPSLLTAMPNRILTSLHLRPQDNIRARLSHNSFGNHKSIVCVTRNNRILALDFSDNGRILWNHAIPSAVAPLTSDVPFLSALPDGFVKYSPSKQSTKSTLFNSMTGQIVGARDENSMDKINHVDLIKSDHSITVSSSHDSQLWTFNTPAIENITHIIFRSSDDPLASIGRVLGDRKVLYKYLNSNLLLIVTSVQSTSHIKLYLIDGSTGETIRSIIHPGVVQDMPLAAVLSENWFAYSFTSSGHENESKSSLLIVGDLYESSKPDDRGSSFNRTISSSLHRPHVAMRTFIIPEPISSLSVTQTNQGITSKDLLAILSQSQALIAIPKAIIDPRRPIARDPNKLEQAEGLVKYIPNLEFDPRWYLSHKLDLLGVDKITTSPAILESTSLVFAYGLDMFGTRSTPSGGFDVLGKDFNKLQMLATVAALGIGTVLVAPLVSRHFFKVVYVQY